MDSISQRATHTENGSECICAGTQMRFLAKELECVAFFLQGICLGVGSTVDLQLFSLDLARLTLAH